MVKQSTTKPGGGGTNVGELSGVSPALVAYQALLELAGHRAALIGTEAVVFALSWLAAGRMLARNQIADFNCWDAALKLDFWEATVKCGMPEESLSAVWGHTTAATQNDGAHFEALSIVQSLWREDADGDWTLFDSLWDFPNSRFAAKDSVNFSYDANLCDLLFDVLDASPGSSVWIPFDPSGQLVMRALRRGLQPLAVGPGWIRPNPIVRLLLVLEPERLHTFPPHFDCATDNQGYPSVSADYLIACPPLGAKVLAGIGWKKWEIDPTGNKSIELVARKAAGRHHVQLDRTDSWALAAFWPAVGRRAVFMTLPNVLFGKGQEQRLRECLLAEGQEMMAVVALPGRLVQGTGVITALMIMDRSHTRKTIRMVSAEQCTLETKSTMRFARILDEAKVSNLVLRPDTEEGFSADISYDQIAGQDFNLVPSRYLRQAEVSSLVERIPLGQLVEAIRSPVPSKDEDVHIASEVGIPELDRWQAIVGPFEKQTSIQPRKVAQSALREGDILLSIKGTVGKTGLIGRLQTPLHQCAVSSQSCVILRVVSDQITPLQLFLYLRSNDFKRQAEAFKVGVSVAHVTPSTLLQDVKVPVKALDDTSHAQALYDELCALEAQIDSAHQRLREIQAEL